MTRPFFVALLLADVVAGLFMVVASARSPRVLGELGFVAALLVVVVLIRRIARR